MKTTTQQPQEVQKVIKTNKTASGPSPEVIEEEAVQPTQIVRKKIIPSGVSNAAPLPLTPTAGSPEEAVQNLVAKKILPTETDRLASQLPMTKEDVKPIIKPRYNLAPTSGTFYLPAKPPQEKIPLAKEIKKKLKEKPPAKEVEHFEEEVGIIDAKEQ